MVIETPDKRRAEVVFAAGKVLYAKIGVLEGEGLLPDLPARPDR